MRDVAERSGVLDVRSVDVELMGSLEDPFVPVRRGQVGLDPLILLQLYAGDLAIDPNLAQRLRERRIEAQ